MANWTVTTLLARLLEVLAEGSGDQSKWTVDDMLLNTEEAFEGTSAAELVEIIKAKALTERFPAKKG